MLLSTKCFVLLCISHAALLKSFSNPLYCIMSGYGWAVSLQSIMCLYFFRSQILSPPLEWSSIALAIQIVLLIVYGARLVIHIYARASTAKYHVEPLKMTLFALISMIISCALLYFCMLCSVVIVGQAMEDHQMVNEMVRIVGLVIMASGLIIETIADQQKMKYKAENPDLFCSKGLYRFCRMPNYFGEVVFWIGNYIISLSVKHSIWFHIFAVIGMISSIGVMYNAATMLDRKQYRNYHKLNEYMEYRKFTPIVIPFIPFYSFEKYDKLE